MSLLSDSFKSYYWQTTEDCLVELHGLSRTDAIAATNGYRSRLATGAEESGPDWMEDLEYHLEPFSAACDLANNQLDYREYLAAYFKIVRRNQALAEITIQSEQAATILAAPLTELPQPTR